MDTEVGMKVKEYLTNNGISQTHLGKKIEMALPKLNLTLNGKRHLKFDEYELMCGTLGLNTDYFLKPKILIDGIVTVKDVEVNEYRRES